ncbi:MAG: hypothetical protein MK135_14920, partial [Polyangiaceae bacterium]|nr:hypothetical protein [Polyangiaceae bacterium]
MSAPTFSFDMASWTKERRLREGRVVVTGVGGRLGRRLIRQLHRRRTVFGLDERGGEGFPPDVTCERVDPGRHRSKRLLADPDIGAIVHLGVK